MRKRENDELHLRLEASDVPSNWMLASFAVCRVKQVCFFLFLTMIYAGNFGVVDWHFANDVGKQEAGFLRSRERINFK